MSDDSEQVTALIKQLLILNRAENRVPDRERSHDGRPNEKDQARTRAGSPSSRQEKILNCTAALDAKGFLQASFADIVPGPGRFD